MNAIAVGDVFRDKYGGPNNPRTIQIVEIFPNGVRAQVRTDADGKVPDPPRFTTIKFSTLKNGYRVETDKSESA